MMQILGLKWFNKVSLETFFVFFCTFGYIVSYINFYNIVPLGLGINVAVRTLILVYSLYFIFTHFHKVYHHKSVRIFVLFYAFFVAKSVFTFYNYHFNDENFGEVLKDFSYYGLIVIPFPVIALMTLEYKNVNFQLLYKWIFIFLFSIIACWIFLQICEILFQYSFQFFRSYYITFGHYGVSLLIVCVFDYFIIKKIPKYLLVTAAIFAMILIVYAGARSPLVAVIVASFLILTVPGRKKYVIYYMGFCLLLVVILYILYQNNIRIRFVERSYNAIFNGDASGRAYYLSKGWNEFLRHPILGGRTLLEDGQYPHNFLLEILSATGIVGAVLIFFYYKIVFIAAKNIYLHLSFYRESAVFLFFFIQFFVLSQTSGSIGLSFEEWHFGALIIGISLSKYYEKT